MVKLIMLRVRIKYIIQFLMKSRRGRCLRRRLLLWLVELDWREERVRERELIS